MNAVMRIARNCLIVLLLTMSGCDGDGRYFDDIYVDPESLTFRAVAGGPLPAGQELQVSVEGEDTPQAHVSWARDEAPWLEALTGSTESPFFFNFWVNSTDLPPGRYSIDVTAYGEGFFDWQTVPVTYIVSPSSVSVTPTAIYLVTTSGSPVEGSFVLNSTPSSPWRAATKYADGDTNWLTLSQTSGPALPAAVTMNTSDLPEGTYSAVVELDVSGAKQSLPVTLVVTAP